MKKVIIYLKNKLLKNKDKAQIEIGPLQMLLEKKYKYDHPHETSLYIPRVEIRERIEFFSFSKTREIIYNSITIVDAPRAPLSGENNGQIFPKDFFKEENTEQQVLTESKKFNV
ncbi:MAG: hypothetical protein GXW85_03630 [Clostridia bacterium]|nr:hypothetical protein [Clostridia bacterium]